MDKPELEKLLERVRRPMYKIEKDLGMPMNTLQRAVKGTKLLPKKWLPDLKDYVSAGSWISANLKDSKRGKGEKSKSLVSSEKKETDNLKPKNLDELKALCPYKKGTDEFRVWVAEERQKYNI